jgi:hypothetical protein
VNGVVLRRVGEERKMKRRCGQKGIREGGRSRKEGKEGRKGRKEGRAHSEAPSSCSAGWDREQERTRPIRSC